jgi:hypothetical protein
MNAELERFVAAGPWPQRAGLKLLLEIASRPRGHALVSRLPLVEYTATSLIELARYDEPQVAHGLGWDAEAIVARGRKLRNEEGRP